MSAVIAGDPNTLRQQAQRGSPGSLLATEASEPLRQAPRASNTSICSGVRRFKNMFPSIFFFFHRTAKPTIFLISHVTLFTSTQIFVKNCNQLYTIRFYNFKYNNLVVVKISRNNINSFKFHQKCQDSNFVPRSKFLCRGQNS